MNDKELKEEWYLQNPQTLKEYERLKEKYQDWYFKCSKKMKFKKPLEDDLLKFIYEELSSAKQETLQSLKEKVGKMKRKDIAQLWQNKDRDESYNQAIADFLTLLENE